MIQNKVLVFIAVVIAVLLVMATTTTTATMAKKSSSTSNEDKLKTKISTLEKEIKGLKKGNTTVDIAVTQADIQKLTTKLNKEKQDLVTAVNTIRNSAVNTVDAANNATTTIKP